MIGALQRPSRGSAWAVDNGGAYWQAYLNKSRVSLSFRMSGNCVPHGITRLATPSSRLSYPAGCSSSRTAWSSMIVGDPYRIPLRSFYGVARATHVRPGSKRTCRATFAMSAFGQQRTLRRSVNAAAAGRPPKVQES